MTESLASLCYLLVALLLGLGIGGTIWLVATAVTAVKSLEDATRLVTESASQLRASSALIEQGVHELLTNATTDIKAGMQATQQAAETVQEMIGVATEQISKVWARTNAEVRQPRPWHAKDAVNGAAPEEEQEKRPDYRQEWREP